MTRSYLQSFSEQSPHHAGVIRVLGPDLAEVPALAVRPELQGNSLGCLLLALLENAVREAGVKLIAMPALVPFPSSSPKQAPASDGQATANEQARLFAMLKVLCCIASATLSKKWC